MSTSIDPTHDISLVNYHVKDLVTFGATLTAAAAAAFPNDLDLHAQAASHIQRPRYQETHVLLISWEVDTLGVEAEILELKQVFEHTYAYNTQHFRIPEINPHNALARELLAFLEAPQTREALLIVYYGGHGFMNDDRQCVWSCTGMPHSPTVQWFGLQTMLETTQSDVLMLLDCCAAASSVSFSGTGLTELVAACGFEMWTPGGNEHSFTRSLIEELKYWAHGPTLTVALLHNKVLSRMKYWKPRFGTTGEFEHRRTPIYVVLANAGQQRSIELAPLVRNSITQTEAVGSATTSLPTSLPSVPTSSTPSTHTSTEAEIENISSSGSSMSHVWPDATYEFPRVLIHLSVTEDQTLRTGAWMEWLRSVPGIVKYARVEGLYRSDSVLLLLSVPVAVWNLIPKDPAVRFLSFVRSPNLLVTQDDTKSPSPTKSAVVHSQRVRKSYLSPSKRKRNSPQLTPQPSRMDLGLS